jgi:ATP:ADP antiporter, AAA family
MIESDARGGERSALDRALGIVTEVRAGEGPNALLMTLNVFLLLTAYYVIKPVREGLILSMPNGAEYKAYLGGAIAVALLFAVPAYGAVADRITKSKLVVGVTLFFTSHLVVFYVLSKTALQSSLGLAFFVWVGIFNMMLVAQFWAFANDTYSEEQGKRLFPLLGIGAAAGGAFGAYGTTVLVKLLGTYQLMLVSAGVLVASALLTHLSARRQGSVTPAQAKAKAAAKKAKTPGDGAKESGTFSLVLRHRYLVLIAAFSVVFTFVNTNGEYLLGVLVKADAVDKGLVGQAAKDYTTGFYGSFFRWVNIVVLVLQTFAVSRIVKFGGLRLAFFILPLIALLDATGVAVLGSLAVVQYGKIAENATDYSVNNTVRNMLWLPTTTDMKYKAKQAVDTFMVRMGDVLSGLLVYVAATVMHLGVRAFALVNVGLVGAWLVIAVGIVRENARLTLAREEEAASAVGARSES